MRIDMDHADGSTSGFLSPPHSVVTYRPTTLIWTARSHIAYEAPHRMTCRYNSAQDRCRSTCVDKCAPHPTHLLKTTSNTNNCIRLYSNVNTSPLSDWTGPNFRQRSSAMATGNTPDATQKKIIAYEKRVTERLQPDLQNATDRRQNLMQERTDYEDLLSNVQRMLNEVSCPPCCTRHA